jgi:hypothetical protein
VDYWTGPFRELTGKGIAVTVCTRVQDKPGKAALVTALKAAGCRVVERPVMHEKVMIVDGEVLWHGSLNLLCNSRPTDLMMRLTNTSACERVRRIMDRATPDRHARSPARPAAHQSASDPSRTGVQPAPGVEIDGRLYLKVPYEERNEAKRLVNAQWDKEHKLWWTTPDRRGECSRWLPPNPPS